MSKHAFLMAIVLALGLSSRTFSADNTGRLGLNYTVGPSFIVGGDLATDTSSVQPGVGAGLQLGLSPHLLARFDYDYLDADLRTQALTVGAQWDFAPRDVWNPFVGAGLGFGKPYSGEGWDHFSLKLEGGLQRELTANVSLAGVFKYQFVDGIARLGDVHVLEPGLRLIYYFGKFQR